MNAHIDPEPGSPLPRPKDRRQFDDAVYVIARCIPRGKVLTYGTLAELIPTPAALDVSAYRRIRARWVGYALAGCPDDVPWQRIVNRHGHASKRDSGSHEIQRPLLFQEGVPRRPDGTVDLSRALWQPSDRALEACGRRLRRRWQRNQ